MMGWLVFCYLVGSCSWLVVGVDRLVFIVGRFLLLLLLLVGCCWLVLLVSCYLCSLSLTSAASLCEVVSRILVSSNSTKNNTQSLVLIFRNFSIKVPLQIKHNKLPI